MAECERCKGTKQIKVMERRAEVTPPELMREPYPAGFVESVIPCPVCFPPPPSPNWHNRQTDVELTRELLETREQRAVKAGFKQAKWLWFGRELLGRDYRARLTESCRSNAKKFVVTSDFCPGYKLTVIFLASNGTDVDRHIAEADIWVGNYKTKRVSAETAIEEVDVLFESEAFAGEPHDPATAGLD